MTLSAMTFTLNGLPYRVHSFERLPVPEIDVEKHVPGEIDSRPAWSFLAIREDGKYFRIVVRFDGFWARVLNADDVPVEVQTTKGGPLSYGSIVPLHAGPYIRFASGKQGPATSALEVTIRPATLSEVEEIEKRLAFADDSIRIVECDYIDFRRIRWKWCGADYSVKIRGGHIPLMLKKLYHNPTRTLTSRDLNKQMSQKVEWGKIIKKQVPKLLDGHLILHQPGSKSWTLNIP